MVKQTIQIFGRIKPTKAKTGPYEVGEDADGCPQLQFSVPRELHEGIVNNKKELYKFRFQRVFDQSTKQDEIFEHVAKPVIDNVLAGYNGTIFAYGQTGSGKTFTITGGAERYIDRGIIPRTISYIFEYCAKNSELAFTTHISYLEIYNENGYDLLDPKHEASKLEDLPKVALMEDSDQNIHLKNLSTTLAGNEEEALNLLFLGDTNRMIAETPMNQASTRSHCIFTMHVTSREEGSATIRRAKLHLVDLAGSERVSKTGVNGLLLTEAKYINLSLHYLEQVIVSLSDKNRQHIPYRNSMMTSVLRDSLGGNCMTTMIATCSVDKKNIDESISTCRFAQRVAMIKNDAILNEELDPKLMIAKLKREVAQLKEELSMATGQQRTEELSEEDMERCEEAVRYYLDNSDPEGVLSVGADMRKIHHCFSIMKRYVLERKLPDGSRHGLPTPPPVRELSSQQDVPQETTAELQKLKGILQQRDNEINILVNMLKKEKKRAADAVGQLDRLGQTPNARPGSSYSEGGLTNGHSKFVTEREDQGSDKRTASVNMGHNKSHTTKERATSDIEEKTKKKILGEMSMGRQEAFEIFRRDYEHNQTIEENKHVLKLHYAEAKNLGENVNTSRVKINKLKASIEQHRMSRVMQGQVDPDNPEPDHMEMEIKTQIEAEKQSYKQAFNRLRSLKTEIEHLQHLLERSKVKLMKDFEIWWAEQGALNQAERTGQGQIPPPAGHAKNAWRTPPMSPNGRPNQLASSQNSLMSDVSPTPNQHRGHNHHSRAPIPGHIRQSLANSNATRGRVGEGPDPSGTDQPSSGRHGKSHKSRPSGDGNIPLTGDAQADADIMAFLKARQSILKHAQYQNTR